MAENKDEIQAIHLNLRQKICDDLDDGSDDYDNLMVQMERLVGKGFLRRQKTLQDKFDALERRGYLKPGYYDKFKEILEKSNNDRLLDFVKEAETAVQRLGTTEPEVPPTRGVKRPAEDVPPVVEPKRPAPERIYSRTSPLVTPAPGDEPDPATNDEYYSFNPKQKGYLLILNFTENRSGTQYDVDELVNFFRDELKFEVDEPRSLEEQDFTKDDLKKHLTEIQSKLNLEHSSKKFYCFICVILSHGDQKGIRTREEGFISVEEIRKMFDNKNVPRFTGRPKLFFIQACRGTDEQGSEEYDDEEDDATATVDESDAKVQLPTDADTLVAFSTTPGWKSFRRTEGRVKGSWFIQECISVFQTNREDHVEDMLVKVRHNVAKYWRTSSGGKQMPCIWTTLTKKLVLK